MSKSIGFIGFGNMAKAMVKNIKDITIRAYDPIPDNIKSPITSVSSVVELVKLSDIIIISVKPQIVDKVLPEIKTVLTDEKIVVSIAAGVSAAYLSKQLGTDKIVQVMPNTPMLVGAGASALARLDELTQAMEVFCDCVLEEI